MLYELLLSFVITMIVVVLGSLGIR